MGNKKDTAKFGDQRYLMNGELIKKVLLTLYKQKEVL